MIPNFDKDIFQVSGDYPPTSRIISSPRKSKSTIFWTIFFGENYRGFSKSLSHQQF